MKLPVSSRVAVSRITALAVVLSVCSILGVVSDQQRKILGDASLRSNLFMREKSNDLEGRSRRQAEAAGVTVVTDFDRRPFETVMAGLYAKALRDPSTAEWIERIRKAE
jgi:TRAP-type C4-dicarboxylate transport system substrate-binding protein